MKISIISRSINENIDNFRSIVHISILIRPIIHISIFIYELIHSPKPVLFNTKWISLKHVLWVFTTYQCLQKLTIQNSDYYTIIAFKREMVKMIKMIQVYFSHSGIDC